MTLLVKFIKISIITFLVLPTVSAALLKYLTNSSCLVYITFTTREIDDDEFIELFPQSKNGSSGRTKENSLRLTQFLGQLPYLHAHYKPFLIQRQCDCTNSKVWYLSTNKFIFESFLQPYPLPACIDFLIFQRSPDQIEKVIQAYKWISWWKSTFLLLADFGLSSTHNPSSSSSSVDFSHVCARPDGGPLYRKLLKPLRKYKSRIVFTLTPTDSDGSRIGQPHIFGIICYFCLDSWIVPLKALTWDHTAEMHTELNRENGHGAPAIINRRFQVGDIPKVRQCESSQFFEMQFQTECTRDKIFLSILSKHLNFTTVSGDFLAQDNGEVLSICITFCYGNERYLSTRSSGQMFITANEVTRFIYCQKMAELELPEWQSLTDCFNQEVWMAIFISAVALGIMGRRYMFFFDYLFLIIGQSVQANWKKWTPWIAMALSTTIFISIYYQSILASSIIAPLQRKKISTIKELFMDRHFKYVKDQMPSQSDWVILSNFRSRGVPVLKLENHIVPDERLKATTAASVWDRVGLAGVYAGRGALLLDSSKMDYAIAIARYIHPNLSCDSVKEAWSKYWDTWMFKAHLADRMYLTKFRLMQAGVYAFWKSILGYERYYFVQSQGAKRKKAYVRISLNSTFILVFQLFVGMAASSIVCFVLELSWGCMKAAMMRNLFQDMSQ